MNEQEEKPRSYKVILKNGDYGIFTNDNFFDNFEDRLLSGIYGISTIKNNHTQITPETVLSIEEVETPTEDS